VQSAQIDSYASLTTNALSEERLFRSLRKKLFANISLIPWVTFLDHLRHPLKALRHLLSAHHQAQVRERSAVATLNNSLNEYRNFRNSMFFRKNICPICPARFSCITQSKFLCLKILTAWDTGYASPGHKRDIEYVRGKTLNLIMKRGRDGIR
jgi:hypothetical protein